MEKAPFRRGFFYVLYGNFHDTYLRSMTIQEFQKWKREGCPFRKGAEIYEKEGSLQALKTLFRLGENEFSREKLITALEGLAYEAKPSEGPKLTSPTLLPRKPSEGLSENSLISELQASLNLAQEITTIDKQLINLYKLQSNAHSKMKLQTQKAKRGAFAVQIIETGQQIRALISRKKYIEQNNTLPPEVKELSLEDIQDRAELKKKQLANRVYISKNKNRPQKAEEVARRTRENEEIEKILGE